MRRLWGVVALCLMPLQGIADVCAEGAQLTFPNFAVAGELGLSVIVAARRHPAREALEEMTVAERVEALEQAFLDDFGAEAETVQDLRRLGAFVEAFRLNGSGDPSVSIVLHEPEYVITLLPTLRRYGIDSGVTALEDVERAFWGFEGRTTGGLFDQFAWGSFLGVTFGEVRDTAPEHLIAARDEVERAISELAAEERDVSLVLQDKRARLSEYSLRTFMMRALEDCAGDYGGYGSSNKPEHWETLNEAQRVLLTLDRLQFDEFQLVEIFANRGWMLEDAIHATEVAGLPHHAEALRDGLSLFPSEVPRDSDAWFDGVWDQVTALEDLQYGAFYEALLEQQGSSYEVSFTAPIDAAIETYGRHVGLWPQDPR